MGPVITGLKRSDLMLPVDGKTLLILLLVAFGAFMWLRVVGREKHRREKWLQWRIEEQIERLQCQEPAKKQSGGSASSLEQADDADEPTVLQVVSPTD